MPNMLTPFPQIGTLVCEIVIYKHALDFLNENAEEKKQMLWFEWF